MPSDGKLASAPRPVDIPDINYRYDCITIPTLPPVRSDHRKTTIPTDWQSGGPGRPGPEIETVDWRKLDRAPRVRSQSAPVYPDSLIKDGITGTVDVEFMVDKDGNVCEPVVVRASNPGFIGPAVRAVALWKFEPGRSAGRNVRFRMSVPVVFTIGGA
jgi:TonB family protein